MTEEIKEILDIERYRNKDGYVENISVMPDEIHKLLDYITNLQQENEFLKLNNPEMNIEHFRIVKENKRKIDNLRKENEKLKEELENYKSKCEKTIELYKKCKEKDYCILSVKMYEILNGENND